MMILVQSYEIDFRIILKKKYNKWSNDQVTVTFSLCILIP
jgi:hypothetical protein